MKKVLLISGIVLLSLSSCKKDPVDNTDKVVTTVLPDNVYETQYAGTHTNGNFYISGQSFYSLNAQGVQYKYNSLLIHGSFYKQANSPIIPGGEVRIDTIHFPADSSYDMQQDNTVDNSFFGRNIEVMLTPPVGQAPPFTAQVYLPELLFAQIGSNGANIFKPSGDTLIWNADAANKNGMKITFDYDPTRYVNIGLPSSNYITKTIAGIADNGKYVIPENIFSMFPSGGYIDVKLSRDATTLVSYNQFKYILHCDIYTNILNKKIP